jgi:epoxyqueuosine reductase
MTTSKVKHTNLIKAYAKNLGFMSCGISKADFLEEEAPRLEQWLSKNHQGEMSYMNNHFDKRLDPRILVPGAKSVVSLLLNYYTNETQEDPKAPKISKYAFGRDYHSVIKDKLKAFMKYIHSEIGEVDGRVFVDSAPVMDKAWAKKSGLGWIGKNTNLISKKTGSFFFIAELIIDLELEYDHPTTDHCGSCTACIDACPTEALIAPYKIDGSKCISYLTIELKDQIPSEFKGKMDNWVFGCDACQTVCPWNRFSKQNNEASFDSSRELLALNKKDWIEMTEDIFETLFQNSAIKRTKYEGLKRNIKFISNL